MAQPKIGVRVVNLGANVDAWCDDLKRSHGSGSSTYDVCSDCVASLARDPHCFDQQLQPYNGDPQGDAGWGDDGDHPPFDGEDYKCTVCNVRLCDED